MREIKFRAWDRNMNGNGMIQMKDFNSEYAFEMMLNPDKHNIVLMQFTGLKDKNRKEIYEGDIVKHLRIIGTKNAVEEIGVIEFFHSGFISMVDGQRWDIRGDNDDEIIGNKFENPELLK